MVMDKVQEVNKILLTGEPANISVDEHSGYTGYKPQAVVDAMNEVFWGEWGFEEISSEITPGEKGLAIAQVRVWLKGVEFKPTGWGQNRVTRGDIGDARKGAQTDALKKALSYFSIGNRAYHGLLPDKKEQAQQARQQQTSRPTATAQKSEQQEASIPQASEEQWQQIRSLCEQLQIEAPVNSYNTHQAANVIKGLQKRLDKKQAEKANESKSEQEPSGKDLSQQESVTLQAVEKFQQRCVEVYGPEKGNRTYNNIRAHVVKKLEMGDVPDKWMTSAAIELMWNTLRETMKRQAQTTTNAPTSKAS